MPKGSHRANLTASTPQPLADFCHETLKCKHWKKTLEALFHHCWNKTLHLQNGNFSGWGKKSIYHFLINVGRLSVLVHYYLSVYHEMWMILKCKDLSVFICKFGNAWFCSDNYFKISNQKRTKKTEKRKVQSQRTLNNIHMLPSVHLFRKSYWNHKRPQNVKSLILHILV